MLVLYCAFGSALVSVEHIRKPLLKYHTARQSQRFHAHSCRRIIVRSEAQPVSSSSGTATQQTAQPTRADEPQQEEDSSQFHWHRAWYPVAPVSHLDPNTPNPVTILGLHFVAWKDKAGQWRAARDQCPHRLAPLSEGWVVDGELQCRYHGWKFDHTGKCTACPQAKSDLEQIILSGNQHSLQTVPTTVRQGLMWLWPTSGPMAWIESAASPAPCFPEVASEDWAGSDVEWSLHHVPCGWPVMVENALDPSHAPFLHEGLLDSRRGAAPMSMSRVSDGHWPPQAAAGFKLRHGGYTREQQGEAMQAERAFIPPCTIRLDYRFQAGRKLVSTLYLVPVEPGVTRAIGKFVFQAPGQLSWPIQKLYSFGQWCLNLLGLLHAFGHGLLDQDVLMLHAQERALADNEKHWRSYRLATPSDTGVKCFWHWLQQAGGDVPWPGGKSSFQDLPPRLTRAQLLDHYERHTQYCPQCQQALKRIQTLRGLLLFVGSWALLLTALGSPSATPLLLAAAVAFGVQLFLWHVRTMFFSASHPPGSGWRDTQATKA
ncbi:hypothetical protein WJX73_006016 [Symbiochloris irregularis]|uniref:Rieske domain-containing protein n=1 Tax=Symbiochloris irregularis TaxID=706552 RepID=A0AAW1P5Y6_9CHLO